MAAVLSGTTRVIRPGSFDPPAHFYARALAARPHPTLRALLAMSAGELADRYAERVPGARPDAVRRALQTAPERFRWSGCDLLHAEDETGARRMLVIETNSCPSGQKSTPPIADPAGGYRALLEAAFLPAIERAPRGRLAVIYDKNELEASGYAAAMADLLHEDVLLAELHEGSADARFEGGMLRVRDADGRWQDVRAALRYVTQRPWDRIPVATETVIVNPIVACLAGGRNKALAMRAYATLAPEGLAVHTPETFVDVRVGEVAELVCRLGGRAVVKVPYTNAGQGVTTIASPGELARFLAADVPYERVVVQALVGGPGWGVPLRHVGVVRRGARYAADLRVLVVGGPDGFRPVALYARRARVPLGPPGRDSWAMLGTNLSVRTADGGWRSETERLVLLDEQELPSLGLGIGELVEATVQAVLATLAVDRMAGELLDAGGALRRERLEDTVLVREIRP